MVVCDDKVFGGFERWRREGWGSEFKRSCGGKELSHKNYTATTCLQYAKVVWLVDKKFARVYPSAVVATNVSGLSSQIHAR